jgi:hypothetical protein
MRRNITSPFSLVALVALALVAFVGVAALVGAGEAAPQAVPSNQSPPTISGTMEVGKQLTASTGSWSGTAPITYAYSWQRCDVNGGSCSAINGATERTYTLKSVDAGDTMRVRVTATNSDGSASATSVPTAVVKAAPTPPAPRACDGNAPLQASALSSPERLSIDGQQVVPSPATRSTQTLVVRIRVTCNGKPVQGALVYITAVPYNQFSVPQEQATGADGWVQLSMNRLVGYPATPRQQLLVLFARARKPSDNVLAGISTRRLISFPVLLG